MIIEKEPVVLESKDLTKFTSKNSLTQLQTSYLQTMLDGKSLEQLIHHYYSLGWLVNFSELFRLTQALVEQGFIKNKTFHSYFDIIKPKKEKDFTTKISDFFSSSNKDSNDKDIDPRKIPFLRSLRPEIQTILLSNSKVIIVPKNTRLIKSGTNNRDLFILLEGEAYIYKTQNNLRYYLGTLTSGAIFGELGFLLGQLRSADIITQKESRILFIEYIQKYEALLNTEKAEALQIRIWVIHALLNSEIFKYLPAEYFDMLIFSGNIHKISANQTLFKEGDKGVSLFIVIQGSIAIYKNKKNINVVNQGGCLGEVALFVTGGKRTATAYTQSETLVMEIPQQLIYKLLGQNILLAKELEQLALTRIQMDQAREK